MPSAPHPLYVYGPVLFVAASALASAVASPFVMRYVRFRFGPLRRPIRARLIALLVTIAAIWTVSTLIGLVLLALPPVEREGRLPGDHIDAAVLAHVVPTTASLACDQLVGRLEKGAGESRWSPPGAREARLVLAARIDRDPDRAIRRLAKHRFRTHAGRFALGHPTGPACTEGLDALAEAMRGGALKELMGACRNAPGDVIAYAAFKVGDFMISVGPETESIISRQPQKPRGEPECWAEGEEMPPASMPLCRLEHAELHPAARAAELKDLVVEGTLAKRWLAAMRVEQGGALPSDSMFTIDPRVLVLHPFAAVIDEPIGVYEDIRQKGKGTLTPGQSAWIRLAIGAERSAMGRDDDAAQLVKEAYEQMAIGAGATDEERRRAARVVVAIGLRGKHRDLARDHLPELAPDDPLRHLAAWLDGTAASDATDPAWAESVEAGGPALAAALDAAAPPDLLGLVRLGRAPDEARPLALDWLREAFPACTECHFFSQLDHHATRLDAVRALGDPELEEALGAIVARFEAVFLNRNLALSLRLADPETISRPSAKRDESLR